MIQLTNTFLAVTINPYGAELSSVQHREAAIEYLWQADPAYWGRHASNLFPIIGRLKDDQYTLDGQEYGMSQHGFARNQMFTVMSQTDTSVRLRLTDSAETRSNYPFSFQLDVVYTLQGNQLAVAYEVTNPSATEALTFAVGGHPAFNVPFDGGDFADYQITVSPEPTYQRQHLNGPYLDRAAETTFDAGVPLPLVHDDYVNDAIILTLNEQETRVQLRRVGGDHSITMILANAPYVGLWTPPHKQAPFIALEPWWGIADTTTSTGNLHDKFAATTLAPQTSFSANYALAFD